MTTIPPVVPPLPRVSPYARNLPVSSATVWLRAGWHDLTRDPLPSLLYGLFVFLLSAALIVGLVLLMLVIIGMDAPSATRGIRALRVQMTDVLRVSKGRETVATGVLASFRGTLATAFFGIAFVVTGFLAAFNRISWAWVALVVVGAFLVFAGPAIVANLRSSFS